MLGRKRGGEAGKGREGGEIKKMEKEARAFDSPVVTILYYSSYCSIA